MMKRLLPFIAVVSALALLPSCKTLYPNLMFQQGDYQFFELAQKQYEQYVIKPGDVFTLRVYSRDGFKLVDVLANVRDEQVGGVGVSLNTTDKTDADLTRYIVDNEGFADIPVLGQYFLKGFTEAEIQRALAEKYAGLFVDPYVVFRVVNRRAIVFKGGIGTVVPLNESPTNLLELLAKAGGLDEGTKAYNIKIIRGDFKNPQISLVDLSTIEGIRKADLAIQANDIVYVEKRKRVAFDVFRELTPYLSLLSTVSTILILSIRFGK